MLFEGATSGETASGVQIFPKHTVLHPTPMPTYMPTCPPANYANLPTYLSTPPPCIRAHLGHDKGHAAEDDDPLAETDGRAAGVVVNPLERDAARDGVRDANAPEEGDLEGQNDPPPAFACCENTA